MVVVKRTSPGPTPAEITSVGHWHYYVYGQRLCSNMPLLEGCRAGFDAKDMSFRCQVLEGRRALPYRTARLRVRGSTDVGSYLSLYESEEGFVVCWEDRCEFLVSADGRLVQARPLFNADPAWVQNMLYSSVLSFALHLRRISNFHASAAVLPQGAVGFLADPGSGKSTLAAGFALAGHPFLSDDVLAVQEGSRGYLAYPGLPYVSLSPRSLYSLFGEEGGPPRLATNGRKQQVAVEEQGMCFSRRATPLAAFFVLKRGGPDNDVKMERLPRFEAIKSLLENTNCAQLLPQDVMQGHLAFVAGLVARVPVYSLQYPSDLKYLPQVITAILERQGPEGSRRTGVYLHPAREGRNIHDSGC